MLNIVLFGPPGAGKGTQAKKLIDSYSLIHLSTGDLLRNEISNGTTLGLQAKSIMDKGELVSDEIVIAMIENQLAANKNANGFIFDGFPRTTAQAQALDAMLERNHTAINLMIALEVDNVELTRRLLVRGHESGRADDQNEDVIKNRINEYNNKTAPLKSYYSNQGKFHSVYGIGSIDQIFELLCATIDNKTKVKVVEPDGIPTIADVHLEKETHVEKPKEVSAKPAIEAKPKAPAKVKKELKKAAPAKPAKKAKTVAKAKKEKSAPKAVKKTIVKKAAKKKVAKKKVAAKPAKKLVKKAVKKVAKKATKKVAKKVIKKAGPKKTVKVKKAVKKATPKKAAKKPVKKQAKKAVKKSVVKKKLLKTKKRK